MTALCQQALPHQPYDTDAFRNLYSTLRQPSSQIADNITLREALRSLQNALGTTVWLDRRVDGEQPIHIAAEARSHLKTIELIGEQSNTEIAWLENLLYFAPANQAARIEAAYWKLSTGKQGTSLRKSCPPFESRSTLESREFFEWLSNATNLKLVGLESLPHDRWEPSQLKQLSVAAAWTVALAGFEKSIEWDNKRNWELVSLPESENVELEYVGLSKRFKPAILQSWRKAWPSLSEKQLPNGRTRIEAPVSAHRELITRDLEFARTLQDAKSLFLGANSRFTTTLQGNVGELLPKLAKQLDLELTAWPLDDAKMNRYVSIELKDATLDEMFGAIARESKLNFSRDGQRLRFE
jgi:hypothetical protein